MCCLRGKNKNPFSYAVRTSKLTSNHLHCVAELPETKANNVHGGIDLNGQPLNKESRRDDAILYEARHLYVFALFLSEDLRGPKDALPTEKMDSTMLEFILPVGGEG